MKTISTPDGTDDRDIRMAFINERITDEDIEKYNLIDLWDTYKADDTISVLDESKPYNFVIDRQSENWLINLAIVKDES